MKKIVLIFAAASFVGCTTVNPQNEQYYASEDPFARQLEIHSYERQQGKKWIQWSAVGIAATLVGASVARTGVSMEWWGEPVGNIGEVAGYALVTAGSVTGYLGYERWRIASEEYIETLHLQSQYYNLIY